MCARASELNPAKASLNAVLQLGFGGEDSNLFSVLSAVGHDLVTVKGLKALDVVHQNLELVLTVVGGALHAAQELNDRVRPLRDVDGPEELDEGLREENVALVAVVFFENIVAAHAEQSLLGVREGFEALFVRGRRAEDKLGKQYNQEQAVVPSGHQLGGRVDVAHEAPRVRVERLELLFVFNHVRVPRLHLEADVLPEAAQQRLEEPVALDLELNEVVYLVVGVARD